LPEAPQKKLAAFSGLEPHAMLEAKADTKGNPMNSVSLVSVVRFTHAASGTFA